jgi:RNA-binding protein YhbY
MFHHRCNPQLLLTFNEVEKLWVGVDRTLLSIGSRGVTDKHANSLSDLLRAHTLVKVKFNGNPEDTTSQAEQLASSGAAQLLQLKGKTALYAAGMLLKCAVSGCGTS